MGRAQGLLVQVLLRLALALAPVVGLIALHVWLVDVPVRNDLGFGAGLLHGVLTPINAARWLLGGVPVKDFASGWGYEAGYVVGALGLLSAWQTVLQVVAHRATGRRHRFDRPALTLAAGFVLVALAVGALTGASPTPPAGPVPPLWNVVPGGVRHAGMAIAGLLVGASGGLGALALLVDARR